MTATVDILIPTYCRPTALAITLTGVMGQTYRDVRIVISDQTDDERSLRSLELMAILRVLRARGHIVDVKRHLPTRIGGATAISPRSSDGSVRLVS